MLRPVALPPFPNLARLPIAAFDGRFLSARKTPVRTLADLLDYALAAHVECDCRMSVSVIPPAQFLKLSNPPPEDTPIRDLGNWLMCRKCSSKRGITVRAATHSNTSLVPRKGFLQYGFYKPTEPYVPAPALEYMNPPSNPRPPTRTRRR